MGWNYDTRNIGFHIHEKLGCIGVRLTRECIADCTAPGSVDALVSEWVKRLHKKLEKLDQKFIRRVLKPYGAWDAEDLADDEANYARLLWVAAGACKDQKCCTVFLDALPEIG